MENFMTSLGASMTAVLFVFLIGVSLEMGKAMIQLGRNTFNGLFGNDNKKKPTDLWVPVFSPKDVTFEPIPNLVHGEYLRATNHHPVDDLRGELVWVYKVHEKECLDLDPRNKVRLRYDFSILIFHPDHGVRELDCDSRYFTRETMGDAIH